MMNRPQRLRALALAPLIAALAACGGGGGGDDSGTPAGAGGTSTATVQGLYLGSIDNSVNNAFEMIVLEDGSYWTLYGSATSQGFYVNGFLHGSGASDRGTFTSSDAHDFGFAPSVATTVRASFASSTVSGTLNEQSVSASFSGSLSTDPAYVYDTPASIASISGDWTLSSLDGTTVDASISSTGAFTATNAGCAITGTATPRASGKNVFDVALTFGGSPCLRPGGTASGIAYVATLDGSSELTVLVVDSAHAYGLAADGVR